MTSTVKIMRGADDVWAGTGATTADVLKRQHAQAEADRANLPAQADINGAVDDYLKDLGGPSGKLVKFSKDGRFVTTADGEEIEEGRKFVVPHDEVQVGLIKFNGHGEAPDRRMGPLFKGFKVPARSTLGDLDESLWEIGLNGKPADPWQSQIMLPLADIETGELFVFTTTSMTGRRAVGNLIAQCQRLGRTDPDKYLVVALKIGGFDHAKFGRVKTPAFAIVGKMPKDASKSNDMNDSLAGI
jgi:hypothetical protein